MIDMKLELNKTYINNELAIKPYYYLRSGKLHVRYTVDRAFNLTDNEVAQIKKEFADSEKLPGSNTVQKQKILADKWNLCEHFLNKHMILDAITTVFKGGKQHDR